MIKIDFNKLPQHIAIIMDGNGRWAKQHAIGRIRGHKKGAQAVRTTVKTCREIGIKYLTLYAFSIENWERPAKEVDALMLLLEEYLAKEIKQLHKQGIRLTTIGEINRLDPSVKEKLLQAKEITINNDKMVLNIALSYGGKDEIICAVKKIIQDNKDGKININEINKETFSNYLYTSGMPDPDLLIRTSGEQRISNFMLWQLAYTELYFTDILWPDFREEAFIDALNVFEDRSRRFGG